MKTTITIRCPICNADNTDTVVLTYIVRQPDNHTRRFFSSVTNLFNNVKVGFLWITVNGDITKYRVIEHISIVCDKSLWFSVGPASLLVARGTFYHAIFSVKMVSVSI